MSQHLFCVRLFITKPLCNQIRLMQRLAKAACMCYNGSLYVPYIIYDRTCVRVCQSVILTKMIDVQYYGHVILLAI